MFANHVSPARPRAARRGAAARLAAGALALAVAVSARASNHPELHWLTVETGHFLVHYHDGAEATARAAAEIAEAIYPGVTGLYEFEPPGKTHLVIADYEDYANGAAYFFDGKMEIWATNLEFDLRGTTQWLWNVITHEFTHMVNIQAAQRTPRHVPAVYFQIFGYENERRTDVLTGYPNTLVSYPWSSLIFPAWFAEGTAQYMAPGYHHDQWDAHRQMILRAAVLEDRMLDYDEMSLFKGSLASEQVYDHGYGLVRHIAEKYGVETIEAVVRALRDPRRFSAEGAFRKSTGKTGRELYDEWRAALLEEARAQEAALGEDRREGRPLNTPGTYNVAPEWSPDGRRLAWLSNMGGDYHRTSLVVRSVDPDDSTDADIEVLAPGAVTSISWSPDGKTIYFARREEKDRYGAVYFDLFALDIETKKETRLTRGARLRDPAVSPDGARLAAVWNHDGTNDLVVVDLPAEEERAVITPLTSSPFGRQIYKPAWHRDGRRLIVAYFEGGGEWRTEQNRELAVVEVGPGAEPRVVLDSKCDDRDPVWMPDGETALFVCDTPAGGIRKFDVYRLAVETGEVEQVSNVIGGAFYPAVSPDGKTIAYAGYTGSGYKIFLLPLDDALGRAATSFPPLPREGTIARRASFDWDPRDYRNRFTRFLWSPRLVIDDGRVKVGAYGSTGDVLNKQSFFGGAAYGQRGDLDAFALYENRFWYPTLFLEGFWIRKHHDDRTRAKFEGLERTWDLDLRYDAFEADVGARLEKGDAYSPFYYREISAAFRHSRNHLNLRVTKLSPIDDLLEPGGLLLLPKDGWDYYRGYDFLLTYFRRAAARAVDAEINPAGREVLFRYTHSRNKLSPSGESEVNDAGVIRTIYEDNNFNQLEGSWTEGVRMPWGGRHTLSMKLAGGWIDRLVDDFFWFRIGSRPGLRGYTYYTLEGRAYALARATYRFPIAGSIDRRLLQLIFERLYGGLFAETGIVWQRPIWDEITRDSIADGLVSDVGFELRLDLVNFYTFPARMHFEAAYPLDSVELPAAVAPAGAGAKSSKDWRLYFGLLFGY